MSDSMDDNKQMSVSGYARMKQEFLDDPFAKRLLALAADVLAYNRVPETIVVAKRRDGTASFETTSPAGRLTQETAVEMLKDYAEAFPNMRVFYTPPYFFERDNEGEL